LGGEVVNLGPSFHAYTRREPLGVVGVITPWNAPLNQAARAVASALAAGNAVVAKPSEFASATTLELARIASESGLPAAVLDVVTGTGKDVGEAIVSHPMVRKVSFTGSVRAGTEVGKIAAERIIPLTLELGGKSPNIVFGDADLAAAVRGAIEAFVANAGQTCVAGSRLLVDTTIHDAFVQALGAALEQVKPGELYGPQITNPQFEKVQEYFAIAQRDGATLLTGGKATGQGWLVEPTIYTDVTKAEQRGLADSRDCRRLGGAPPCLPAHLMLEEGTHPQPHTLPAEHNRRADKAPTMDMSARIQWSTQSPCRFFEQARLPFLEVIDSDRQPAVPGRSRDAHGLAPLVIPAEFAPGHLAAGVSCRVPAPSLAQRFHQK
jgi:hypothetical protein